MSERDRDGEHEPICRTKLTERVLMFVVCRLLFVILHFRRTYFLDNFRVVFHVQLLLICIVAAPISMVVCTRFFPSSFSFPFLFLSDPGDFCCSDSIHSRMVVVNFRPVSGLSVLCHIATDDVRYVQESKMVAL